ncbi:MAG: VanZ family protein [Candidatus Onthomonas sp.]
MLLLLLILLCALAFFLFCSALCGDIRDAGLMAYALGCSLLPWVITLVLAERHKKRQGIALVNGTRWIWMALFGLDLALVFEVTGAGTLYEALYSGISPGGGEVNLLPFSQIISPLGYALNLLLGMPLGFLLPLLWDRMNRTGVIALSGLALSLLIELSQLCNYRTTDVDDLIMNTLGTLLGWLAFRLFTRLVDWKPEERLRWPVGPVATVMLVFLGRFLLYRESWITGILYG